MFKVNLIHNESNVLGSLKDDIIKNNNDTSENLNLNAIEAEVIKPKKSKVKSRVDILDYFGIFLLFAMICFFVVYMVLKYIGYDFDYFR